MLNKFYLWLREKIAGKELNELAELKQRLSEMKSYMGTEPKIVEAVDWIAGENKSNIQGFRDSFRFRYILRHRSPQHYREQVLKSTPKYYGSRDASELIPEPVNPNVDDEPSSSNVVKFPRGGS
ncbi:hypothetical protein [Vibrio phage pTD1]|uniref:Uncharacterized protein n=1 Tax=Vibrio phage pTD1 TaxID=1938577 RepID=A0A1Q2U2P6_9CAUD|nr:hypothetical protein FDH33_gp026 [Vibrio phage pTD1]BAW98235.1 hypothetical protein [Vibrio phage pTD1]